MLYSNRYARGGYSYLSYIGICHPKGCGFQAVLFRKWVNDSARLVKMGMVLPSGLKLGMFSMETTSVHSHKRIYHFSSGFSSSNEKERKQRNQNLSFGVVAYFRYANGQV